jgi:methyl-accepting chemotaxis protein
MKLKLYTKLLIFILTTSMLIFAGTFGYFGYNTSKMVKKDAMQLADAYAREFSNLTKSFLNEEMIVTRSLAQSFKGINQLSSEEKFHLSEEMLKSIFEKNQQYRAVWMSWEISALDPTYTKNHGRYRIEVFKRNGETLINYDTLDLDENNLSGVYLSIKQSMKETITDPYYDSYTDREEDNELIASVAVPFIINNEFKGLVGIDIPLARYQMIIEGIDPFETSTAYLIANNGMFVAHQKKNYIGTTIDDYIYNGSIDIKKVFEEGIQKPYNLKDKEGNDETYVTITPFVVGNTTTPWAIGIEVPVSTIMEDARSNNTASILVGIVGLILLAFIIIIISRTITKPLSRITQMIKLLAKGEINRIRKTDVKSKDEIAEIASSVNTLVDGLHSTADFAEQIGKGNLRTEYTPLGSNDVLGNALLEMRESLRKAKEEEIWRKKEDEKHNWTNTGFAKFGDLLRHNTDDMKEFSYNIISNLVKYLDANQGGLFFVNDENENDVHISLMACYAYNRKKFLEQRIDIGENLVGRCVMEGETIFMTEIPDDYINITSGLGDANPKSLLIVPLKFNDNVFGVIEIASFNVFEKYQISFVERIGESIASTISSLKINIRTVKLLEESKHKSEELASQEEEMRQNMEELQTTQEESARREAELNGILDALNSSYLVAELDFDGTVLSVNDNYLKILGEPEDNILGNKRLEFISEHNGSDFEKIVEQLKTGKSYKRESMFKKGSKEIWLSESFSPILNTEGEPFKILNIATDITERIESEKKLKELLDNK